MIYRINTRTEEYIYQTGDIFKKSGKQFLHIRNGKQVNSYSEQIFNQVLYSKKDMQVVCTYPITYEVTEEIQKEEEETDNLILLLDANPPNDTEETPELTQDEEEFFWQADLDAAQRAAAQLNSFYS